MTIRLYVGNLPKEVDRKKLQEVFAEAGESVVAKVIKDRKGKCRGFGFVTVPTDEEADQIIEKYNGYIFEDNALKIEKALPRAKRKSEEKEEEGAPQVAETERPVSEKPRKGGGGGGGGGGQSKARRNNNASEPEAIQPDPRWADDLEKLKQMLAAQATNS
ncbi:RNA-binding protein [[Phormidium] sp. ETS-05]|uniref:RNA recognition motif domain-containing protein n=1 Tax=[Phormidium] sp. ETS-05 TaxID=222819 RepID=UPI0018EED0E2|nr:RNA-binding protein [[Phormidium] sp. ETS-05]